MHANEVLLNRFYEAFQKRDGATMAGVYSQDARFSDPVFTDLQGDRIGAMWQMLCERGKDLEVTFDGVEANDERGRVHWEARYTFSATGKRVHNVIDAEFTFSNGRVATHRDRFDLYRWCRQALGAKGLFLGWLPPVQKALRSQAAKGLDRWVEQR